jgi:hypothetical protein
MWRLMLTNSELFTILTIVFAAGAVVQRLKSLEGWVKSMDKRLFTLELSVRRVRSNTDV